MKIKSWEELDNVVNAYYAKVLHYHQGHIQITSGSSDYIIFEVDVYEVPSKHIIKFLKEFGFDVEFEELPKLSKRAYHYVNYLPDDAWLATDRGSVTIFAYNSKPKLDRLLEWDGDYFTSIGCSLFPFITPDRAWSVKELRELEVQNDD